MARYLVATHRGTLTRDWLCTHCQAFGHVTVAARGRGEKRLWFSRDAAADAAHERAAAALDEDADRIVSLIRCPTCRERAPRAMLATLWHGAADLLPGVGAAGIVGVLLAAENLAPWIAVTAALIVLVAITALGDERRRWREAGRAQVDVVRRRPSLAPPRAPARPSQPLSADPFRAPPAPPPIAIVRPPVPTAAPLVSGDPSDKPTFLV